MHSTVQLKPVTNTLYLLGATDKNISSDRPPGKLLIQIGNLRSGKATQANLRSDLKGENSPGCQTGCADKGGGVQTLQAEVTAETKSQRRERKHGPVAQLKKL